MPFKLVPGAFSDLKQFRTIRIHQNLSNQVLLMSVNFRSKFSCPHWNQKIIRGYLIQQRIIFFLFDSFQILRAEIKK